MSALDLLDDIIISFQTIHSFKRRSNKDENIKNIIDSIPLIITHSDAINKSLRHKINILIETIKSSTISDGNILKKCIKIINKYILKSPNKTSLEILQEILPTLLSFLHKSFSWLFIEQILIFINFWTSTKEKIFAFLQNKLLNEWKYYENYLLPLYNKLENKYNEKKDLSLYELNCLHQISSDEIDCDSWNNMIPQSRLWKIYKQLTVTKLEKFCNEIFLEITKIKPKRWNQRKVS